jgi:23S rRNA (uracil1939-C5)-methyltransferase
LINRVASVVRRALVESDISSYSESVHLGTARYLQVVVERESQTAQVVLVANSRDPEPLKPCFDLIITRLGEALHSLWFNRNQERTNTILGEDFQLIHGKAVVVEQFGGALVHYPPGAFGQNNLEVAESLIAHVGELIPCGSRVVEFYAGVGAIGLSILTRLSGLVMNEVGIHSLAGMRAGLAALCPGEREKVTVVPGAAGDARECSLSADVVIVDPPRKGLDPVLLRHFSEHPPRRLVYVSCGLESFLRDVEQLCTGKRLKLSRLKAFDMLPYTDHVESVACFERH